MPPFRSILINIEYWVWFFVLSFAGMPEKILQKVLELLRTEGEQREKAIKQLEFQIWDFGGHKVYYTTHQVSQVNVPVGDS